MIKPDDLESEDGRPTWDTLCASADGDVAALRGLLDRNPRLGRAEVWYSPAVHGSCSMPAPTLSGMGCTTAA